LVVVTLPTLLYPVKLKVPDIVFLAVLMDVIVICPLLAVVLSGFVLEYTGCPTPAL
jgi:hypothetical protein